MTKNEKMLLGATLAVMAAAVLLEVLAGGWLNGQQWFSVGANIVQLISAPLTFGAIAGGVGWYWSRRCATPGCVRFGEHPVAGTTKKVCHGHHSSEQHRLIHAAHQVTFGWGASHRPKR